MTAHDTPATARRSAMTILSLAHILAAGASAAVAIREGLPGAFLGRTTGRTARGDFLLGAGTALSPGLAMLAAQAALTLLARRGGRAGAVGAAGLALIGAGATVGLLGEPIVWRVLSRRGFDAPKAALVAVMIALPVALCRTSVHTLRRGT
jgi:hypothetical protein